MSNLVERLRGLDKVWPATKMGHEVNILLEAADEIEQLEYDLGKCREGSAIRTRINDHQVEKIRRLEVERDAWKESRDARVREALNKDQP